MLRGDTYTAQSYGYDTGITVWIHRMPSRISTTPEQDVFTWHTVTRGSIYAILYRILLCVDKYQYAKRCIVTSCLDSLHIMVRSTVCIIVPKYISIASGTSTPYRSTTVF